MATVTLKSNSSDLTIRLRHLKIISPLKRLVAKKVKKLEAKLTVTTINGATCEEVPYTLTV